MAGGNNPKPSSSSHRKTRWESNSSAAPRPRRHRRLQRISFLQRHRRSTTKPRKQNKPSALLHKSVMKKEFRRMAKAVLNQIADNYYRPDPKKDALARLSVVNRSLKVAKSWCKEKVKRKDDRTRSLAAALASLRRWRHCSLAKHEM